MNFTTNRNRLFLQFF